MDADVIVVGAGPTGLTLACGLQAAGVAVRVLDSADAPAVTSCALGLQPRGVEVLDRVGALGDLPKRAIPVHKVIVTVEGRQLARLKIGLSMERLGGRGMNTGIGDAENLAWKLALVINGRADENLLDTYEAERRPIAKHVLESTSGLTGIVMGESRIALSRAIASRCP